MGSRIEKDEYYILFTIVTWNKLKQLIMQSHYIIKHEPTIAVMAY
jgi:hypothetical protein